MKLITYDLNGAARTGAVVKEDAFVDVSAAGDVFKLMTDAAARNQAADIAAKGQTTSLSAARLLAPYAPRNLICIGLNYMDHVRETKSTLPDRPVIFAKFTNALANPNDAVTWYGDTLRQVDYEAELAVVIGKPCYRVAEADALAYVGGYTCGNDISARDIQNSDSSKQWTMGKTPDGFYPIGPALVTADDIPDPQALGIRSILNGQVMQDSNTKEMIFSVARLIAHISRFMTLMPGDLISTGTPHGVGAGRNPQVFMKDGDEIVVEIDQIGTLCNRMRVL